MTRTALWLVQARTHGEPWRTLSRHLTRLEAQAAADCEAARVALFRITSDAVDGVGVGGTSLVYAQNLVAEFIEFLRPMTIECPVWAYVRLSYRGSHIAITRRGACRSS